MDAATIPIISFLSFHLGRLPLASELSVIRSSGMPAWVASMISLAAPLGFVLAVKSIYPPILANRIADSPNFPTWVGLKCLMGRSVSSRISKIILRFCFPRPIWMVTNPGFPLMRDAMRTSLTSLINSSLVKFEQRWSERATLTPKTSLMKAISFFTSPVKVIVGYS